MQINIARGGLLALIVIGFAGVAGPAGTVGLFSDTVSSSGAISVTADSGGVPPEDMNQAFNDANGNGYYDEGEETTYTDDYLANFDEPDANLVIPESVGSVDRNGQDEISMTAGSITSAIDLSTKQGNIDLNATNGSVTFDDSAVDISGNGGGITIAAAENVSIPGSSLSTKKGDVDVDASGAVNIDGATVSVSNDIGAISFTGTSISGHGADLGTKKQPINLVATAGRIDLTDATIMVGNGNNGDVIVSATDDITLNGSTIETHKSSISVDTSSTLNLDDGTVRVNSNLGSIDLQSNGNMSLRSATLETKKQPVTANLELDDANIFVDGLTVDDDDGILTYRPGGVTESPERSNVSP